MTNNFNSNSKKTEPFSDSGNAQANAKGMNTMTNAATPMYHANTMSGAAPMYNAGTMNGAAPMHNANMMNGAVGMNVMPGMGTEKMLPDRSIADYRAQAMRGSAAVGPEVEKAAAEAQKINAIVERWKSETERLMREVPDFDLDTAMKNDEFRELVIGGMSIDGAYYSVVSRASQGTRRPIMQNAYSKGMKSGSGVNDVTKLSDKDFQKKIKEMMND